jgi:hypothetical protein
VGVDHGGLDVGVSHELLHSGKVNAAHHQATFGSYYEFSGADSGGTWLSLR